jgi:coproporphyrinogen III oxidase-like Fe-S oxidoreductase
VTGASRQQVLPTLTALQEGGLLTQQDEAWTLTAQGRAFLNDVIEAFL